VPTQCPTNSPSKHVKSGLYVRSANGLKLRDRKVQRLVRAMRNTMHWLEESDIPACRAWAQLEILSDRAFAILRGVGLINRSGDPIRLLTDFRQLRLAQLAYERELGMTPVARKALQANGRAPLDLAAAMANGDVEDVESEPEKSPQSG
jgi:hypothetical protein